MTNEFFWQHLYYAYFNSERNSFLETLCLVALIPYHLTWNSPRVSPHRCQSVSSVNQMRCDMQVDGPALTMGSWTPRHVLIQSQTKASQQQHCYNIAGCSEHSLLTFRLQTSVLLGKWASGACAYARRKQVYKASACGMGLAI